MSPAASAAPVTQDGSLVGTAARALSWSFLSTAIARVSTLAIGVALARLLGNPELAHRLGDGGRRRARGAFSWDRAARAIYEAMLASLEAADPGSPGSDDGRPESEPPLRQ